ncbi:MAG: hypothetical protein IPK82_11275 [Polyangiaceae bacterium]|nr:hypothetical protein [Polyangiaceae bacterium]
MDGNLSQEIEQAVHTALAASGVGGKVSLVGRTMSLRVGTSAPVEVDVLYLIDQWPLLPEDLRQRKASDLATRLTEALRRAEAGQAPPTQASVAPPAPGAMRPSVRPMGTPAPGGRKPIALPIGGAAVVVLCALVVWLYVKPDKSPPPPVNTNATTPAIAPKGETDDERRARVCEVARKRVLETGTLTQLDAEVWLTELWLATSKAKDDPARAKGLADLIAEGRLTAAADADLAAIATAKVEIVGEESAPGGAWKAMHVRFRGGYTSAFFDAAGREKMLRVAAKIADVTGAEVGALYGRCAHLRYHDVSAWFRGASPQLAASALLYSTGFFSERRLTNRDVSSPVTSADLTAAVAAAAKFDKAKIESAVRDAGGTFAPGTGDAPTTIMFPLFGPTRAERTCKELAELAKIDPASPR